MDEDLVVCDPIWLHMDMCKFSPYGCPSYIALNRPGVTEYGPRPTEGGQFLCPG